MIHVMLDLETWGKRPGCDIRSIGAVVFDPVAGTVETPIVDTTHLPEWTRGICAKWFYLATENPTFDGVPNGATYNYNSFWNGDGGYCRYPLTRDPGTVKWWNDRSEEARAAFANSVDLREACGRFGKWLRSVSPISDYYDIGEHDRKFPDDMHIWANGPQFDVSILEAAYHAVGLSVPWHYRAPRDFRTIVEAAGMTRDDYCTYGDAHNALHDAIAQAMTVCEAYKRLGLST